MKTYVIVVEGDNVEHHLSALDRGIRTMTQPAGAGRSVRVKRAFVRDVKDEDLVRSWEHTDRR